MTISLKAAMAAVFLVAAAQPGFAAGRTHKIAVHVDQSDKTVLNMALNNVQNLKKYYDAKGDTAIIEVVAYGPGLTMLRDDTSPVKDRIETMSLEIENLTFSACANTQQAMSRKDGKEVALIEEATIVPSGVARLIELQEEGYTYVRP
ncbi:DsrE family protein [Rhodobium gokarnense]|uniref:Intracellular sulfur oxidation DsrE/DsrF family protein n=1 Tax=Rhodobium gokarnense TaxID=364296 RepID=A0ABT3H7P4_9HYPH|nr:DsrE family protein [Rhodobium gokarnense]MCW2306398.1 intracellular sulfur oxidation DsrE/DsrF family protein [Rhodobium gokarnense]